MKNVMKKGILGLALATAFLMGFNVPVSAKQIKKEVQSVIINGHPVMKNNMEQVPLHGEKKAKGKYARQAGTFPSKYDVRAMGGVTAVDNQWYTGNCWAFASIAAIEGDLIKKGYANNSLNLSENHLAYFFYHQENDPLGNIGGDNNVPLSSFWWDQGGNAILAAFHLQAWSGPIKESPDEDVKYEDMAKNYDNAVDWGNMVYLYDPGKGLELPAGNCYKSDYRIKNSYFYVNDVNMLKQAVTEHGAVTCGVYMSDGSQKDASDNYWNEVTNALYNYDAIGYNSSTGEYYPLSNHAVTIVGWDDNFSKNNFSTAPKNNGAWIIKNSWGKEWGDNGYFYLSYEDPALYTNTFVAYDVEKVSDATEYNYQYDGSACGNAYSGHSQYANTFTARTSESVKEIGLNLMSFDADYKIQIYTGLGDSDNPTSGTLKCTQEGTFKGVGYQTIKLNKSVAVSKGERYSVVVTVDSSTYIGWDETDEYDESYKWLGFYSSVGENQSYILHQGRWLDTIRTVPNVNFRIKAYTDSVSVKLNATKIPLQVGKSTKALKITSKTPSNDKVSKWTTSNKKIATVDKKGKITGKKKGTATITVIMKSGAKAKCKVTVQKGKVVTKKLKLSKSKYTLKKGKSLSLIVSRNPITATEKLTWSTSNKKVATVDKKGKVKAKKKGKATITVKSANGKKAKCTITVK